MSARTRGVAAPESGGRGLRLGLGKVDAARLAADGGLGGGQLPRTLATLLIARGPAALGDVEEAQAEQDQEEDDDPEDDLAHRYSTFPGFMMPFGSKVRLIARMSSSSSGEA